MSSQVNNTYEVEDESDDQQQPVQDDDGLDNLADQFLASIPPPAEEP